MSVDAQAHAEQTRTLASGTRWLTASTVVVGVVNYLFALLLTRVLDVDQYQAFAAAQALLLVIGTIAGASVPWVVARWLATAGDDRNQRRKVVWFAIKANIGQGLVGGVVVGLVSLGFAEGHVAALVGASAAMIFLAATAVGWLQGEARFQAIAGLRITEVVLKAVGGMVLAVLGLGAAGALSGFGLGAFVVLVLGLWIMREDLRPTTGLPGTTGLWGSAGGVVGVQGLVAVLASLGGQELSSSRSVLVGNSAQLGGYLVLLAGLSLALAVHDPHPVWGRAGRVAAPVALTVVLLTGSYAAVLGGAALLVLAALRHGANSAARRWWAVAGSGAAGLLAVALAWSAQFRPVGPSLQGRVDTWRTALAVVGERPLFGWGPEGFRHGFASQVPETFVAEWGDLRIQDRAHSLPLDHAASAGLVGVAALLALVVLIAVRIVAQGDQWDRAIGVVLVAYAGFLLGWFLEFDLAAVVAFLAGAATSPDPPGGPSLPARALAVTTLLAAGIVGVGGSYAAVEDHRFQRALDRAVAEVRTDVHGDGGGPDEEAAAATADPIRPLSRATAPSAGYTELLVALELAPAATTEQLARASERLGTMELWHDPSRDAEVALLHAEILLERARRAGDASLVHAARAQFEQVLDLAPNHSVAWRGLATSRLLAGDPAAREALAVLASLRPDDPGPLHDLAAFELQQGEVGAAAEALADACRLAPRDQQLRRLADALRDRGADPVGCP